MRAPAPSPDRACALHDQLRTFLLTTMPDEAPADILAALQYEVVSLIASHAETLADVDAVFARWTQAAREQIACFGLGEPHP